MRSLWSLLFSTLKSPNSQSARTSLKIQQSYFDTWMQTSNGKKHNPIQTHVSEQCLSMQHPLPKHSQLCTWQHDQSSGQQWAPSTGSKPAHWPAQPCPKQLIIALYNSIWIPQSCWPRCWGDAGCGAAQEPPAGASCSDVLLSLRRCSLLATAF